MNAQELTLVKRVIGRWREAVRVTSARARNDRAELARVEAEISLIADELAAESIDWRSPVGLELMAILLKKRLGIEPGGEPQYPFDSEGFRK
jgi:hypothetical protein